MEVARLTRLKSSVDSDELDGRNGSLTIYVVKPWRPDSEAIVVEPPEDGDARITFKTESGADACYFLEVFIAREFLEDRASQRLPMHRSGLLTAHPCTRICNRLIHYALVRRLSQSFFGAYRSICAYAWRRQVSARSNVEQSAL